MIKGREYIPRYQSSCGQHGAHLGPVGPRWAPCWPHEPCYQGYQTKSKASWDSVRVIWWTIVHEVVGLHSHRVFHINSLDSGIPGCHLKTTIFNLVILTGIFTSSNVALRWMPWDLTDDKSTLVQVMTWCRQATSHYLSQCWPSSMSPYGVTRPQWDIS